MRTYPATDSAGVLSVPVDPSLRGAVRARRRGWRVYVAPTRRLGVLGPVVCATVLVAAVVLVLAGVVVMLTVLDAALFGVLMLFVAEDISALAFVAFFLVSPLAALIGWLMAAGGRAVAAAAMRFAFSYHRLDVRPGIARLARDRPGPGRDTRAPP
jgi:hypothetical protein